MLVYLLIIYLATISKSLECYYSDGFISSSSEEDIQTVQCSQNIDYCIIEANKNDFDDISFQGCDTAQICQSIGSDRCEYVEISHGKKELICCCDKNLCNEEELIENFDSFPFRLIFLLVKAVFYVCIYFIMCFFFYKLLKKVKIVKSDINPGHAFIPFYNQYLWVVKVAELAPEWFCISLIGMFGGCWICIEPYISIKAGRKFGKSGCWSCVFLFLCRLCGLFSLAYDDTVRYSSDIELRVRNNGNNAPTNIDDGNNDSQDAEGDRETYVVNQIDMASVNQINQPEYIPPILESPNHGCDNEDEPLITTTSA